VSALDKKMRDFAEEVAKVLKVARADQDKFAHASHRRAIAASERGFFSDLVVPIAGIAYDLNPNYDATLDKLSRLPPVAGMENGGGTLTDGNSAPLTDGAAAIWVATSEGLERLPPSLPRVRLVDWVSDAVDLKDNDAHPMAPVYGIPLLLARHGLKYLDIALWEIHEAFAGQVLAHIAALESPEWWSSKMRVNWELGRFPCDRVNPNGGSIALGDPFGAAGARILSQAVKELAAMPHGSLAVVNIYAEGGQGTSVLLEHS
jgi:acetyl-CoA C-acetyltransferase